MEVSRPPDPPGSHHLTFIQTSTTSTYRFNIWSVLFSDSVALTSTNLCELVFHLPYKKGIIFTFFINDFMLSPPHTIPDISREVLMIVFWMAWPSSRITPFSRPRPQTYHATLACVPDFMKCCTILKNFTTSICFDSKKDHTLPVFALPRFSHQQTSKDMYIRNMVLSYTTKKTRHEPIRLWNFFHMIPCFYKKSRHLASLDSYLWMKIYFKAKDIIYEDEDKDLDHFHGWLCTKSV